MHRCLAAACLPLLLAVSAGHARPPHRASAVLVVNTGTVPGYPIFGGVYAVSSKGSVRRVVARRWAPAAVGRGGVVAAFRRGRKDPALAIVTRRGAIAIPGSSGARCVAWSRDGRLLTYVTGAWAWYAKEFAAGAYHGTLWIASRTRTPRPVAVAAGFFPSEECAAWSNRSSSLAYVVGSRPRDWKLRIWQGGATTTVAALKAEVPSSRYRTFDWAPGQDELTYVNGLDLRRWSTGRDRLVGAPDSLLPLEAAQHPYKQIPHGLRYSPDGRFVAVSQGALTAVFRADGMPVRVVRGIQTGWAGNSGVLTTYADNVVRLVLWPLRGGSRPIAKHFKLSTVTDPDGRWFAYTDPSLYSRFVFRRADGTLLRRVSLRFIGFPLAGRAKNGRLFEPLSAY